MFDRIALYVLLCFIHCFQYIENIERNIVENDNSDSIAKKSICNRFVLINLMNFFNIERYNRFFSLLVFKRKELRIYFSWVIWIAMIMSLSHGRKSWLSSSLGLSLRKE